ncbi:hypothetical protein CROQUDRAFT_95946 [Cronartium quercuum f. sp. fusiforme G11]|uniref:Uncharacterized protein n=1 Tax=Cronartium quercuum f. sp. fusiforme G11 TaxID=708437 RepID=A0A9P6NDQ5_9BASI|nr:hypothetical protein CROQUDRAFT_95946 [Cronartium quercuum f. sp. fusiforme G11]
MLWPRGRVHSGHDCGTDENISRGPREAEVRARVTDDNLAERNDRGWLYNAPPRSNTPESNVSTNVEDSPILKRYQLVQAHLPPN